MKTQLVFILSFFFALSARGEVDLEKYNNRMTEVIGESKGEEPEWTVFKVDQQKGLFEKQASSESWFVETVLRLDGKPQVGKVDFYNRSLEGSARRQGLGIENLSANSKVLAHNAAVDLINEYARGGISYDCGFTSESQLNLSGNEPKILTRMFAKRGGCSQPVEFVPENYSLRLVPEFADVKIFFRQQKSVSPQLKSISDVQNPELPQAIINLGGLTGPEDSSQQIRATHTRTVSQGSGFFLSRKGLLATNEHVVNSFYQCIRRLRCSIQFRQVLSSQKVISFKAEVDKLIVDREHDFALLQVHLPDGINVAALQIADDHVGPVLLSAGYPNGRAYAGSKVEGFNNYDLTFSFGYLIGLNKYVYATSVFAGHGASGSPVVNADDYKVVSILASIVTTNEDFAPTQSFPIHVIDYKFGLRDYISGNKQQRVDQLIAKLKTTAQVAEAEELLAALDKEKTLYGLSQINEQIRNHPERPISQLLFDYVKSKGLLAN